MPEIDRGSEGGDAMIVAEGSAAEKPEASDAPVATRIPTEAHNVPLILLTVFAFIFILDWAETVFIPLVVGVIVSYALSPLVERMHAGHIPRSIGAAVLLLAFVGGIGARANSLKDEAASLIETLPEAAQKFRRTRGKEWVGSGGSMEKMRQAAEEFENAASETTATAPAVPRGVTRVQIEKPRLDT